MTAIPIGKIEEGERMKLFRWDVPCQACLVFSLFLSPAAWYTYKIDCMGDKVAEAGNEIISLQDGFVLLLLFILFGNIKDSLLVLANVPFALIGRWISG